MKVGFTGSRGGMSLNQALSLKTIFRKMHIDEFHHGKCIDSDAQAHRMALDPAMNIKKIVVHPPLDKKYEAVIEIQIDKVEELEPKPYLERDRDIVDSTGILIATPRNFDQLHSGTWYTINYAIKKNSPIIILF